MGWLSNIVPPFFSWIPVVVLFIFLLPVAPYKLWRKEKIHVARLEAERVPKFVVTPLGDRQQWEHQTTEHLMWAELRVRNTSPSQSLHNVGVRVRAYTITQERHNISGTYILIDGLADFKPAQVYWSRRDADPQQLTIDIPPGSERTSLIAFSDDSNGPPGILNAPVRQRVSLGGKLEVEVTSLDSAAWRGAFYIECHPHYCRGSSATFEFIPWERWVETHPVTPLSTPDSEGSEYAETAFRRSRALPPKRQGGSKLEYTTFDGPGERGIA